MLVPVLLVLVAVVAVGIVLRSRWCGSVWQERPTSRNDSLVVVVGVVVVGNGDVVTWWWCKIVYE